MINFGYPYNDIVICKDSTDYLGSIWTLSFGFFMGSFFFIYIITIEMSKHHCKNIVTETDLPCAIINCCCCN